MRMMTLSHKRMRHEIRKTQVSGRQDSNMAEMQGASVGGQVGDHLAWYQRWSLFWKQHGTSNRKELQPTREQSGTQGHAGTGTRAPNIFAVNKNQLFGFFFRSRGEEVARCVKADKRTAVRDRWHFVAQHGCGENGQQATDHRFASR